jgi:hypothetical protein
LLILAPLLNYEPAALLGAEVEHPRSSSFGRLAIWSLDNAEDLGLRDG